MATYIVGIGPLIPYPPMMQWKNAGVVLLDSFTSEKKIKQQIINLYIFFDVPHLATFIFLFFYNKPELGVEIDPGMTLTLLPSCIGWGSNPMTF